MKIFIRGLNSCVMRKSDIVRYKEGLKLVGHQIVPEPEKSDIILVWTCAFRQDFRDNSIRVLKDYQDNFHKRVIACGCLASIDIKLLKENFFGEFFEWKNESVGMKELFGVDIKKTPLPFVERSLSVPIEVYKEENPKIKTTHCDQFVKLIISEGCTFNCTYCAEIMAFPPYKSFPLQELVMKCKETVEQFGEKRVVLHGDCVGEYGKDINTSLPELIKALLYNIKGIKIGFKNLHPLNLLEYFEFITRHIKNNDIFLVETPIQSASDRILALMKRSYSKNDLIKIFNGFREYGFKEVETHIIAGFPSEREEEFQETVDFIREYKPKYVLVSSFMDSPEIKASELEGKIDQEEKRRRVFYAYEQIKKEGIICNYDMCDLCQEHFIYPLVDGLTC